MSGPQVRAPFLRGELDLDWVAAISLGLAAYLLGSVPTAFIVVYLAKGVDIRQVGTGNVGALNAYHQTGVAGGLLVLAVDAGKGALAVLAVHWLGTPDWAVFLTTPLIVIGHNWPVLLGFQGGKGAAGIFGISLAAQPVLILVKTNDRAFSRFWPGQVGYNVPGPPAAQRNRLRPFNTMIFNRIKHA